MAPLCVELTFDFEADHEVVKMKQAAVRHRKLHFKRTEFTRPCTARDWTWGRGIEGAEPHHALRAAVRTSLARGAMESKEDMPSIVRMSKPCDKGKRRKPAVAHAVRVTKAVDELSDIETTADESWDDFGDESVQTSPRCSTQAALPEVELQHGVWPVLPYGAAIVSRRADESRLSYLEMARRFVHEHEEEQAAVDQLHAKKVARARADREASVWKPSQRTNKRMQRFRAALKARAAIVQTCEEDQEREVPVVAAVMAAASEPCNFAQNFDIVKMARAAARHKRLYLARSERARAPGARDWTWGRRIESAKPHRATRASVRTRLAKGVVEAQEDLPSIVCMSKPGDKGTRRKPAIAHMVCGLTMDNDAFNVAMLDTNSAGDDGASQTASQQLTAASSSRQGSSCCISGSQHLMSKLVDWQVLTPESATSSAEVQPEKRRLGCVIS